MDKKKFDQFGSIENRNRKREGQPSFSGRPRSQRTPENARLLDESVIENPEKSLRRRSQELGLCKDTVRRIIRFDLGFRPYSLQVKQKINDCDLDKRMTMCRWFIDRMQENPHFLNTVWFTDEAHFHLSGHVCSESAYFWGYSKPQYVLQRPLHADKCTAWAAISAQGIVGPFWFVNDANETATVNAHRYIEVLKQFVASLRRKRIAVAQQWFMQDGATPHTANVTLDWVKRTFQDRIISRRTAIEWAPHSPDLNPCDFYLWGYLKGIVYRGKPETIADLKEAIEESTRGISTETCKAVIEHFKQRVQKCIEFKGMHFEHLMP